MNQPKHRAALLLVFLGFSALTGCGSSTLTPPKVYPTRGRVLMNGQPVSFVSIKLIPTEASVGRHEADGVTDESGAFALRTFSNSEPDGALPGSYNVEIGPYLNSLPAGAKPTEVPPGRHPAPVEVAAEDNDLTIEIP